jgi:arabinogalactan endo-1,4-beta-galactosidase
MRRDHPRILPGTEAYMKRLALLATLLIVCFPVSAREIYFGADLSFANQMDDCGVIYRENGAPKDVFALFKEHGMNVARFRIWTDGNRTGYSTPADVERGLKRAKAQGLQTLLDFHYSDSWADGGKQIIPAAWAKIQDPQQLAKVLYDYTYKTLMAFDKAGVMPDMVQPGNEINHEILDKGRWKTGAINWKRNALLLNAAIKAIRDAGRKAGTHPKVMIQIAQPENNLPWYAAAVKAGVTDFDMIGISYYPKWSTDSFHGLGRTINLLRNTYPRKEVLVVETAYPWTTGGSPAAAELARDNVTPGYPATPEGQKNFLVDLGQTVISNGGVGVFTWAPDWVPQLCKGGGGQNIDWPSMTFFDQNGEVLPAIDHMRAAYQMPVNVTFRFHGARSGRQFRLWGDFFGDPDYTSFPLHFQGGDLVYNTTLMPGTPVHFQVYGDKAMQKPLITGKNVTDGVVADAVGTGDTTIIYNLGSAN